MYFGSVLEFDEAKGFGTVKSEEGQEYFFHCTAIADGSRTIEPGTDVVFEVVAGRRGRWEATLLRPRV
ncbi:MAG: cold shock domain-containing protein [Acidimicrobiales bacterium]|nr:cold shock domain-containing protein [Acidimicrobiales bacterium]